MARQGGRGNPKIETVDDVKEVVETLTSPSRPVVGTAAVGEKFGVTREAVRPHLNELDEQGEIDHVMIGRTKAWFPADTETDSSKGKSDAASGPSDVLDDAEAQMDASEEAVQHVTDTLTHAIVVAGIGMGVIAVAMAALAAADAVPLPTQAAVVAVAAFGFALYTVFARE